MDLNCLASPVKLIREDVYVITSFVADEEMEVENDKNLTFAILQDMLKCSMSTGEERSRRPIHLYIITPICVALHLVHGYVQLLYYLACHS